MKSILTLLGILFSVVLSAQNTPPTPAQIRVRIAKSITDLKVSPEPVAIVKNDWVVNGRDSVQVRIYQPAATGNFPVIYLVHGAAWVAGDLDTHDNICRYLANALQAVVVAVNYRRPPEHKFPAPFDDSYTVFKWIAANLKTLNGNGQLILAGDSAGGQLVGSICAINASAPKPIPIVTEVLINPALNLSKGSVSYDQYGMFIDWYLDEAAQTDDVRISPLLTKDVSKFPPAIIVVGETDAIRNDGEAYHKKLQEAGIESSLFVQPGMGHLAGRWCAADASARPAMDFVVKRLKELYLK